MRASLSLDVDSLHCYHSIHGLPPPPAGTDPIYQLAMPRFFELIGEEGVPATLFLIGADAPTHAAFFAPAGPTGCEVANHSFSHDYRLTQRTPEQIRTDLRQAHEALLPLAPQGALHGLRAPGYNTSGALLEAAVELGYRYDSSLLPSPAYFLARAAAIALHRGRSRSLRGRWQAFTGPLRPYRCELARPWRKVPNGPLLELPIACEPCTRLPLFGTTWSLMPPRLAHMVLRHTLNTLGYVNFELHAIDLLEAREVSPALARLQPGLGAPVKIKLRALRALIRQLRESARVVTLAALAEAHG